MKIIRRGTSAQGTRLELVSIGYIVNRGYAPVPDVPQLGRFPACATLLSEEVTLGYATGEN